MSRLNDAARLELGQNLLKMHGLEHPSLKRRKYPTICVGDIAFSSYLNESIRSLIKHRIQFVSARPLDCILYLTKLLKLSFK